MRPHRATPKRPKSQYEVRRETIEHADAQEFEELDKASLGSIYFRK